MTDLFKFSVDVRFDLFLKSLFHSLIRFEMSATQRESVTFNWIFCEVILRDVNLLFAPIL